MVSFINHLPMQTSHTIIRLLQVTDANVFTTYRNDDRITLYQEPIRMDTVTTEAFLQRMNQVQHLPPNYWVQFGIACPVSNLLIGDIGICLEEGESSVDIGYTFAPDYQGKGLALEAVGAVFYLIFSYTPVQKIRALVDSHNYRSIRLLERLNCCKTAERSVIFRRELSTEYVYEKHRMSVPIA